MSYFCAPRSQRARKSQKWRWKSWREKKKLEPSLPEPNEEERKQEYKRMIDKLNNTISAALARGERKRRR